ncbi:MAG: LysM peptidoglycan-binding domain-containing protein [Halioglobus sp.]|nr:LysM peptidoglycan-binding domain-containing protein [Halioglobus sp.]MBP6723237.1 LysM peptidoglycan-binding domain-containing protein [Halioglobus sp.]
MPSAQASPKPGSPAASRPFPSTKGARIEIEHHEATKTPIDLWERIRSDLSFENTDNKLVDKALKDYRSHPNYLRNMSEGSSLYLYYIVDEVQKRDMPMEIALVPLIESGLNPFTRSPSNAAGLWQITAKTGANLGLEQTAWFDGRRSIHDSTEVALDYLERLHRAFDGDWLLALAAYNAGEGRVARARQSNLDKGLPIDFWSLDLPAETRRFVPKILALSQIVAEPETHNVNLPPVENAPAFEVAAIDGQITLARAADLADISLETLQDLNPGQLRSATAPGQSQELLVPFGTAARMEAEMAQLSAEEQKRWRTYIVRRGDTLSGIARQFHIDLGLLRRVNGIAGSNIGAGKRLIIPGSDWAQGLSITDGRQEPLKQQLKESGKEPVQWQMTPYKVQRGDSLYAIADRFKVSVDDIISWNSLDPGKHIQPGQTLKLRTGG